MKYIKYIIGIILLLTIISFSIIDHNCHKKLIIPIEYKDQILFQKDKATRQMHILGYTKPSKINEIKIVKGTILRPLGWSIKIDNSPTGYAGGYIASKTMVLVCNPTNGYISDSAIWHEWCESILDSNNFKGNLEERHLEIDKASKIKF